MEVKIKNPLTGKLICLNRATHKKLIKDKVLDKDGNPYMDIHQIIAENRCWECKCELYSDSDDENKDEYKCEKCPEIYYSCKQCEEEENGGHPVSADCETLCEGGYCEGCKRRFCDYHWQSRYNWKKIETSDDSELDCDPELYCSDCFKNNKEKSEEEKGAKTNEMSDVSSSE